MVPLEQLIKTCLYFNTLYECILTFTNTHNRYTVIKFGILAWFFDLFSDCNYRYGTTFSFFFHKMLKHFVTIKTTFRTIFFYHERAITEDAQGRFNRKCLLRLRFLRVLCCSVCWFFTGHFVMVRDL